MPFIQYEDCLITINGKSIFASSASLSVSTSTKPSKDTFGRLISYSASNGIVGTLSISFYPTIDFSNKFQEFDLLTILQQPEHLDQFSEGVNGSFAGVEFSNAYLNSFDFSVQPFSPISANASFNIYGPLTASSNLTTNFDQLGEFQTGIANGANTSFVAATDLGFQHTISFDYSIRTNLGVDYEIGSEIPTRVSRLDTDITMNIQSEGFGNSLLLEGNSAHVTGQLFPIHSESPVGNFSLSGIVSSQQLSINKDEYIYGTLTLSQNFQ